MEYICVGIPRFRPLAQVQDKIGWRRFMEGMISKQVVEAQYHSQTITGSRRSIKSWASGLVIKLLECTHGQWLYRNVVVHDATSGTLAMARKEDIQRAIEEQQALGTQDLQDEDHFLLEVNLEDLESSSGERQEYWLVAIQAARRASTIARDDSESESEDEMDSAAYGNMEEDGH